MRIPNLKEIVTGLAIAGATAMPMKSDAGRVDYNPDQVGTVSAPVLGIGQNSSDFLLTTENSRASLDKNFDGNNQETPVYANQSTSKDSASYNDSYLLQLGDNNSFEKRNLSDGNWNTFNGNNSVNLGVGTFGIGYDAGLNTLGFARLNGSTMSFHTYDFGSDSFDDLASFSYDSAVHGTPSGLDFANVDGNLRMIVGCKDAQNGPFLKDNFILDMDALTGSIDQYVKFDGTNEKIEDLSYDVDTQRLALGIDAGTGGSVYVGDFQAIPEPSTMGLIGVAGLGAYLIRRFRI